jgi:hypothetical protein
MGGWHGVSVPVVSSCFLSRPVLFHMLEVHHVVNTTQILQVKSRAVGVAKVGPQSNIPSIPGD